MAPARGPGGSAGRWGPLFGARAHDWAETWEGPSGYGTPVYEYVLDRAPIGSDTHLLDCGCGAGRFARMAADRGASVAGIDAAKELVAIATRRSPEGDFRVGDVESLPWPDASFDWVTGFNSFQFADDKARALDEARRVSRGPVAIATPSRASESGLTSVFKPLFPLFPSEALEAMQQSGIFALSGPGRLEEVLAAAHLTVQAETEIETPIVFDDADAAVRAFLGAGPTSLAIRHSGESAVASLVRDALRPFTGTQGRVTLPGWYRVIVARG
jgi:SAM-dependent methyltransferase